MEVKEKFADNLKHLMKDHNMSQSDLAKALKVDQTTISAWLRAETEPTLTKISTLIKLFDITFEILTT